MLFFLMKMDGRLRLQLFLLVLIVGVGILPDKTHGAGPRCYECGGNSPFGSCDNGLGLKRKCEANQMCVTYYSNGPSPKIVEKGCDADADESAVDCVWEVWGRGCIQAPITQEVISNLDRCIIRNRKKGVFGRTGLDKVKGRSDGTIDKICYCYSSKDLCNNGDPPKRKPKKPVKPSDPSKTNDRPGGFRNFSTTVSLNNGLVFLSALVVVLFLLQDL